MNEKQEPTEIQKFMSEDLSKSRVFSSYKHRPFSSNGTEYAKSPKLRGVGVTRKNKEESKAAKKLAKMSRKINIGRANKKFRPTGSKRRK